MSRSSYSIHHPAGQSRHLVRHTTGGWVHSKEVGAFVPYNENRKQLHLHNEKMERKMIPKTLHQLAFKKAYGNTLRKADWHTLTEKEKQLMDGYNKSKKARTNKARATMPDNVETIFPTDIIPTQEQRYIDITGVRRKGSRNAAMKIVKNASKKARLK